MFKDEKKLYVGTRYMGFPPPLFETSKSKRNLCQQEHNIKDTTSKQLIEQNDDKKQRKPPKTHRETK